MVKFVKAVIIIANQLTFTASLILIHVDLPGQQAYIKKFSQSRLITSSVQFYCFFFFRKNSHLSTDIVRLVKTGLQRIYFTLIFICKLLLNHSRSTYLRQMFTLVSELRACSTELHALIMRITIHASYI